MRLAAGFAGESGCVETVAAAGVEEDVGWGWA
jgi:hypothetical protein